MEFKNRDEMRKHIFEGETSSHEALEDVLDFIEDSIDDIQNLLYITQIDKLDQIKDALRKVDELARIIW